MHNNRVFALTKKNFGLVIMAYILQNSDDSSYTHTILRVSVTLASFSCALSVFGSSLIIGTYLSYDELRKPARSLLFWLSVADLGTALSYSVTFVFCGGDCHCTAFKQELFTLLGIFFPVSSFLWTDCIGLYIYAATYQKTWIAPRERLFWLFHVISWGLPLLTCITIIILKANEYNFSIDLGGSATGGWCWIQQWSYDLLGGKVIEVFSYVFLMIVYVLTWKEMKRVNQHTHSYRLTHPTHSPLVPSPRTRPRGTHGGSPSTSNQVSMPTASSKSMLRDSQREEMRKHLHNKSEAVNRLLFIPVVFFFLRIWGTAHMVLHSVLQNVDSGHRMHGWQSIDQALAFGQAIFDPLQGFCNGILFVVFVSEVRHHLYASLLRYVGARWMRCCALLCCCNYCCRCCCSLCNECCLIQNVYEDGTHGHAKQLEYQNGNDEFDQFDTNYYAAKYQFLPQRNQQRKQQENVHRNMRNPALSPFMASPSTSVNAD